MAQRMIVVAYDIPNDRRRSQVANVLLRFGARIQGSVYELWLDERRLERMWAAVGDHVKPGDQVRCYVLCAACAQHVRSFNMEQPADPVAFIV